MSPDMTESALLTRWPAKVESAATTESVATPSQPTAPESPRRNVRINVLRYNPQERGSIPRMQTYELEEADGMTLFIALNEIREKQDASLQFDFVCRAGICGSCAMVINGPSGGSPAGR
jgi:fumarate reductase iron-sulfur subunit